MLVNFICIMVPQTIVLPIVLSTYLFSVLHLGEEVGGAGLGDGAEVVDEVVARHADAGVNDVQLAVVRVCLDAHAQIALRVQRCAFRQRQKPDLVQRVRPVRDQLSQEDLQ